MILFKNNEKINKNKNLIILFIVHFNGNLRKKKTKGI
jgi:hypothetical protein